MINDFDIPIFKKAYELYKTFYGYRTLVPKVDRYTIWQRSESVILEVLEGVLIASQTIGNEKLEALQRTSVKLNLLRVFVRLMKETKAIDNKRYIALEAMIDEIGRMLGGWIRSTKER